MGKLQVKQVENAKPRDKQYTMSDGGGLTLQVKPNGSKVWVYRYRLGGKPKTYTIGKFPQITLKEARNSHTATRELTHNGIDPVRHRNEEREKNIEADRRKKAEKENSFQKIAIEWWHTKQAGWSEKHKEQVLRCLEKDVFHAIGEMPIDKISSEKVLEILREMESRGIYETVRRTHQRIRSVFNYAVITGRASYNPAQGMEEALTKPLKGSVQNYLSLPLQELPNFLQRLNGYDMNLITKQALKFLILTARRTTEVRSLCWEHIDFDSTSFTMPVTKKGKPHTEYLSNQAMTILNGRRTALELAGVRVNAKDYVFPSVKGADKQLSTNTLLYTGIYRLGYHSRATLHGFRHLFSTQANETGLFSADAIERQLSHTDKDKIRGTYNHALYEQERRTMMQWWADWLSYMETSGEVGEPENFYLKTKEGKNG